MLDFQTRLEDDQIVVIEVSGQLNEASQQYFFEYVGDLMEEGFRNLIIDCAQLGAMSSRALGSLIHARNKAVEKGRKIYLTALDSTMVSVLKLTKVNTLLGIHGDTEKLVQKLRAEDNSQPSITSEDAERFWNPDDLLRDRLRATLSFETPER